MGFQVLHILKSVLCITVMNIYIQCKETMLNVLLDFIPKKFCFRLSANIMSRIVNQFIIGSFLGSNLSGATLEILSYQSQLDVSDKVELRNKKSIVFVKH